MSFPVYLPLLLSAFLIILALVAAGEHHLSGHSDSVWNTVCPAICSLAFFIILLVLTILCFNTTTPMLSRIWLVSNWIHICLGLVCMVMPPSLSRRPRLTLHQYTPVWYFQQLARPWVIGTHLPLFYCMVAIVFALEIGGLALMLDRRHLHGCLLIVLGITVSHVYITAFYLWSIWKRREAWRGNWRKGLTHEARPITCLLINLLGTAISWAIIPLVKDPVLNLVVSEIVVDPQHHIDY